MIAIIGHGNVACHLEKALKDKVDIAMVNSRTLENLPENPDVILLCVSDNAISEVFEKIKDHEAIIAHTSGSIPMSALNRNKGKFGVFYPLQTFSKNSNLSYSEIPVFIEGNSEETVNKLKELACLFSNNINEADSTKRKNLHLASVFACNFTNALAGIAGDILKDSDLDFSIILPLLKETVRKLGTLTAAEAQTGPAKRGDTKVINEHLSMLKGKEQLQQIYSLLTQYIQNKTLPNTK